MPQRLYDCLGRIASQFPLRLVLSIPFIVQFVITSALLSVLMFKGGQETVELALAEARHEILGTAYERIDRYMIEPLQLNALNAEAWNANLLVLSKETERERFFVNSLKAFPEAAMAFVGLPDGQFYGARRKEAKQIQVVRNNKETGGDSRYYKTAETGEGLVLEEVFRQFDPRSRPWYQAAQTENKPVFSSVYRHFVFQEPTITAAHPVYKDGVLAGVFGVDFLLSWMGDMLRSLPVRASGQVFITDSEGYIVAASALESPFTTRDGKIMRIKASESGNVILSAAYNALGKGADSDTRFEDNSEIYYVGIKPYVNHGLRWEIYVVLAQKDFFGSITNALYQTVWVIAFAVLAAFALTFITSRWVIAPILRLNAAAHELAGGRLETVPDSDRKDELGQLSRSFNSMAEQITDLVTNLEKRVEERTRNLEEKTRQEKHIRKTLHAELVKAGQAQRALLPPDKEDQRLRLQILYEPCMLVSGDLCGYHWLDETRLFGYVIDVNGHGAATGLQSAAVNVMLRDLMGSPLPLIERIKELNRKITSYFDDEILVAAVCFEVDYKQKELQYVAAGITEFFADACGAKGRIKTPGMFLGVTDKLDIETRVLPVGQGDKFCFYSDGISDKFNANSQLPVNVSFDELAETVRNIMSSGPRQDDMACLLLEIRDMDN